MKRTKEELKDELKNRISMALKDPTLQTAFEIICKDSINLSNQDLLIIRDALEFAIKRKLSVKDMEKQNNSLKIIRAKLSTMEIKNGNNSQS